MFLPMQILLRLSPLMMGMISIWMRLTVLTVITMCGNSRCKYKQICLLNFLCTNNNICCKLWDTNNEEHFCICISNTGTNIYNKKITSLYILSIACRKKQFKPIANTKKYVYNVDKHGKYKFRLTCINEDLEKFDKDTVSATMYQCKGMFN